MAVLSSLWHSGTAALEAVRCGVHTSYEQITGVAGHVNMSLASASLVCIFLFNAQTLLLPSCLLLWTESIKSNSYQWSSQLPVAQSQQPALGYSFLQVPHILRGRTGKASMSYPSPVPSSCPSWEPADPTDRVSLTRLPFTSFKRPGCWELHLPWSLQTGSKSHKHKICLICSHNELRRWASLHTSAGSCTFTAGFSFGGAGLNSSDKRCSPTTLYWFIFLLWKEVQEHPNAVSDLHPSFADGWTLVQLSRAE